MPCWRPIRPLTPASSIASLMAALRGSSSGSIPPPGTTQQSGRRWLVTNKIWSTHSNKANETAQGLILDCHALATVTEGV